MQALVAGNWKMFGSPAGARALAREVRTGLRPPPDVVEVVLCPPFPFLIPVVEELAGSGIGTGAQDCFHAVEGAFTGEVSPEQVGGTGARYVILGHSERRRVIGESDDLVRKKLDGALRAGLRPILCVGESLEERDAGRAEEVVRGQVRAALASRPASVVQAIDIAYEPVWAIGTGRNATPQQAAEMHAVVRDEASRAVPGVDGARVRVLYGGSVKPANADALVKASGVSGFLVGGASLVAADFVAIVRSVARGAGAGR